MSVPDHIIEISDSVVAADRLNRDNKAKLALILPRLEGVDLRGEFDQVVRMLTDEQRRQIVLKFASDEMATSIVQAWWEE